MTPPAVSIIRRRRASRRGFTLLELVISAAVGALILSAAYLCLYSAMAGKRELEPRLDLLQNGRVALSLLSADLRAACPLSSKFLFLGMHRTVGSMDADNVDFGTHNHMPRQPGQGDFCQVSFFVEKNQKTGVYSLWRRRNPAIGVDPLSGGEREEIARGVTGLKLEYYDGYDWYDTWGDPDGRGKQQFSAREHPNLVGIPEAVKITLSLATPPSRKPAAEKEESETRPKSEASLTFQTIVQVNLARMSTPPASASDSAEQGASSPGGARQ